MSILALKCLDQLVSLTRFGSHHRLPCLLTLKFVSVYALVYGFLLFLLTLFALNKVLDQILLKEQTVSFHITLHMTNTVNCSM